MYTHIYIYTHTHIYIYTYIYTHTYTYTQTNQFYWSFFFYQFYLFLSTIFNFTFNLVVCTEIQLCEIKHVGLRFSDSTGRVKSCQRASFMGQIMCNSEKKRNGVLTSSSEPIEEESVEVPEEHCSSTRTTLTVLFNGKLSDEPSREMVTSLRQT